VATCLRAAHNGSAVCPLNARIAVSSSCLSITHRLRRFTKLQEWDVGSGGHVVPPLADQIARAISLEIAAEHMGENRPIGSRALPLAARSAVRER
jgi:hypothetical protein